MYFGSRWFMKDRKPFNLRIPDVLWNLLLATLSFVGCLRTALFLLNTIYHRGVYYSVCTSQTLHYGNGPVGLWVTLFVFFNVLKVFEMLFIWPRKAVTFVYCSHCITVLLFWWHAFTTHTAVGLYVVVMNYVVIAIWYFEEALEPLRLTNHSQKWSFDLMIWVWLSQMVVGMAVCLLATYYNHSGVACALDLESFKWGIIMSSGYFAPFIFGIFIKWIVDRITVTRLPAPELDPPLCTEMSAPDTEEPPRTDPLLASPTLRQFWKTLGCENLSRCANKCDAEKHSEKASFCVLPAWYKPELQPAQQDGSRASMDTSLDQQSAAFETLRISAEQDERAF
ncbi:hypothetical protein PybrP1_003375 [[Pythium] brassicae (nom. inval.)]|nr:hypothetical protein PybrP1_003375 [[Pythium] brassicae (nom. inval.)]